MDPKELRGLMEAYSEVYAPQEVDEATAMAKRGHDETAIRNKIAKSTGGGEAADRATKLADKQTFRGDGSARDNLARKQRGDFRKTTSSSPGLHGYPHKSNDPAVKEKQAARGAQRGVLTPDEKKRLNREEFDIFDIVLEFLQVEGYAETLEEAEWIMANELDAEDIEEILEAEGSYGQTPKARSALGKLEVSRRTKPVGEYSQRGEKTRKVKAAEKHNRRMDDGPNVGNRGKRSTPPTHSGGRGKMDDESREWSRERSEVYGGRMLTGKSGSVTKNPKKLRKQKAMGEH